MERSEEVHQALGKRNVELLLNEIIYRHLKESHDQHIALAMRVHGLYEQKRNIEKMSLDVTMLHMLDRWWQIYLYDPSNNGEEHLINMLQDINELQYLAHEIKEIAHEV